MDTAKQRKLERLRRAIIGGGILIMAMGNLPIARMQNGDAILAVIASVAIAGGGLIAALGILTIAYRRWVYSVEDRLAELEKASIGQGGKDKP